MDDLHLMLKLLARMSKDPECKHFIQTNLSVVVRAAIFAQTQVGLEKAKRRDEEALGPLEQAVKVMT